MPIAAPPPVWIAPVEPVAVVRRYRVVEAYAAGGHRGIDLRARPGASVRSPCGGTVTFRGAVGGGPPTVTIDCGTLRATLGRVRASVAVGAEIGRGGAVGLATSTAVDLSARNQVGAYRDPLPLLRREVPTPLSPVAVPTRRLPPARLPQGATVSPQRVPALAGASAPASIDLWLASIGGGALLSGVIAAALTQRGRRIGRRFSGARPLAQGLRQRDSLTRAGPTPARR